MPAAHSSRARSIFSGKGLVLVVEDEALVRMFAVDFVEDAGFDVVEAADANQAVAILEARTDIGIVFTDIDVPGSMDGMKLARAVRDRWPPIESLSCLAISVLSMMTSPHVRSFYRSRTMLTL